MATYFKRITNTAVGQSTTSANAAMRTCYVDIIKAITAAMVSAGFNRVDSNGAHDNTANYLYAAFTPPGITAEDADLYFILKNNSAITATNLTLQIGLYTSIPTDGSTNISLSSSANIVNNIATRRTQIDSIYVCELTYNYMIFVNDSMAMLNSGTEAAYPQWGILTATGAKGYYFASDRRLYKPTGESVYLTYRSGSNSIRFDDYYMGTETDGTRTQVLRLPVGISSSNSTTNYDYSTTFGEEIIQIHGNPYTTNGSVIRIKDSNGVKRQYVYYNYLYYEIPIE